MSRERLKEEILIVDNEAELEAILEKEGAITIREKLFLLKEIFPTIKLIEVVTDYEFENSYTYYVNKIISTNMDLK